MQTITINNQVDGYTYITIADDTMGVSADYIITEYSDDGITYAVECDGTDRFEPDYIIMCHNDIYSADGFITLDKAVDDAKYHFYRLVKNYREGWLNV